MYYRQDKKKKRKSTKSSFILPFNLPTIPFKLIGIVLFALVVIAGGYWYFTKNKTSNLDSSIKSAPFANSDLYSAGDNNVFYIKDGTLHILDSNLSEKTSVQLTVKGADLEITSVENVCIAYNSSYVQALNTGGSSLFLKEFNSDVDTVHASKSYVGVLRNYDSEKKQTIINIYDYTGKEVDKVTLSNQYVFSFGFSEEATNMWILAIDTSSATPISKITNYNIKDKTTTGVVPVSGQIISNVRLTSKEFYMTGQTHSMCYSYIGDQVESKTFLIYGFKYLDSDFSSKGAFAAVFAPNSSTTISNLRILNGAAIPVNIQLPPSVTDACMYGDNIFVFAGKTIYKYNLSGSKTATYEMKYDITNAKRIGDSPFILLETSEGVKVLNAK